MKLFFTLALLVPSLSAFASEAPSLVSCRVTGPAVWEQGKLDNLLVDSGGVRSIAFTLVENVPGGAYLTFAHVNVTLARFFSSTVFAVSASSSTSARVFTDDSRPLSATIRFPSRVGGKELVAELNCQPLESAYLFQPTSAYNADPTNGAQHVSTTVANLLASGDRFTSAPFLSRGEYLAANFCVAGDAAAAAAEMNRAAALWRTDVSDHRTPLAPLGLSAARDGSITWSQPAQEIVCLRSHEEKQIDQDTGMETTVTVCDESEKRALPPVSVMIRACN